MAAYSAFTFVSSFVIIGMIGLLFIFVKPIVNMLLVWGCSLAPSLTWLFDGMGLFFQYLPLGVIVSIVIYYITNSQNMD